MFAEANSHWVLADFSVYSYPSHKQLYKFSCVAFGKKSLSFQVNMPKYGIPIPTETFKEVCL